MKSFFLKKWKTFNLPTLEAENVLPKDLQKGQNLDVHTHLRTKKE